MKRGKFTKSPHSIFIDLVAGMIRNSETLRKNIGKGGNRKKEMSPADIKKSGEELKPYWEKVIEKVREGTLYQPPPGE